MTYARRGSPTPNTIKLIFDFRTFDRLKAVAKARRQPIDRCAYELLQERLETEPLPTSAPAPLPEPEDRVSEMLRWIDHRQPRREG